MNANVKLDPAGHRHVRSVRHLPRVRDDRDGTEIPAPKPCSHLDDKALLTAQCGPGEHIIRPHVTA